MPIKEITKDNGIYALDQAIEIARSAMNFPVKGQQKNFDDESIQLSNLYYLKELVRVMPKEIFLHFRDNHKFKKLLWHELDLTLIMPQKYFDSGSDLKSKMDDAITSLMNDHTELMKRQILSIWHELQDTCKN